MYIKDCLKYMINVIPELDISTRDIKCHINDLLLSNEKSEPV